jgi:hypothetical protein
MSGRKTKYLMIDIVPLPDKTMDVEIPQRYLKEFESDLRVVFKPWIFGIPVPELFLEQMLKNRGMLTDITERFDVMLIPKK